MVERVKLAPNGLSMTALLESVLFVASGPVSIGRLAKVLETSPNAIETLLHRMSKDTTRLSQAALEVLSIISFLQPVTRPQIDQIRGVNSDTSLRTLLSQGLIEEVGRKETPGRPILYGTTPDFLQHFGLSSLAELPKITLDEEE
jgi:segregation and condensation protein B